MQNTVDERKNAHGERNLGALFQLAALVALYAQPGLSHLLVLLLQQVIKLVVLLLFPVEMVEEPQEEEQQDDGAKDCPYHERQLVHGMVQQTGARLEFAVLAGLLLQVDIDVAVVVAIGFVVDSRISHAELFADTGNQVGSLNDAAVDEGTVQIQQGTLVVLHRMIARSQGTIGSRYLIDIAIGFEQQQSFLGLPDISGMVGKPLLGLRFKIDIATTLGYAQATVQAFHLLLVNLLGSSLGEHTACTDIVEIVKVLGGIVADLIGI